MSRLFSIFYDRIMRETEKACLREWRQALLADCRGRVLEIGAGTGASLEFYPPHLDELLVCEPDPGMRALLTQRVDNATLPFTASVADFAGERLEVGDESMDAVVSSLVLCSVQHQRGTLHEIYRVLKPGGQLFFLEHVAAEAGSSRHRWQRWIEPVWKRLAGNCHLTRCTEQAMIEAGFEIAQVERQSLRKVPAVVRPSIRGVARKPA
ncbi:class I SAM-dependent methyltransferase [Aestuariirhabdus litorea]|uniref:Class I SAM-dependent methyltransferase n=1 Tax=Aestuariirhabdus litorea TaxID=2528527 RepID=A0A3P3VMS9_9GAMM|nr:class I SAM-dependent methyltransferase [Aestuariirhabdus litorea]RRJ83647.1 class I SAM-dependent methyltransferase [Aestuariirhabdus litorea]RWW96869.1 methyltransferase domain-containing protein [Endozoicomonadaceae bacterium GTF-13]